MLEIDMAQRRLLVASAHHLDPVVMIGKDGLTAGVISELDRGLTKHELIKIKVLDDDRANRTLLLEQICQSLNAAPIKQIGKILIIYRPKPEETEETTVKPAKPKGRGKKPVASRRRTT